MLYWCIRSIFLLLVVTLVILGFAEGQSFDQLDASGQSAVIVICLAILAIGYLIDFFLPRKRIAALAGLFFGLIVGLLIARAFTYILDFYLSYTFPQGNELQGAKDQIQILITFLCCYLAVIFVMQTKDDFRFIIPYVEFSKQTKGVVPLVLDTSVIVDGRIADIATTGFVDYPLIVPRFVLNELQTIADSADRLRRNRGRRGLDMLNKMQSNGEIDITIEDVDLAENEKKEPVDHQLVTVAKMYNGKILTNDYNLNKVASLRGVEVLNINDLANALKTVVLPGEAMQVKLVKAGDQMGQGVGYLEDGTMVVVEMGRQYIGQEKEVMVTSVLQTSAGRMIFGKIDADIHKNSH